MLIPIIVGMLIYTSCEKEEGNQMSNFNTNETELFDKYVAEIKEKQKEGAKLFDLLSEYSKATENYIIEQESFEKSKAWNYLLNIGLIVEGSASYEEKEKEKLKLKQNALNNTYSAYIEKAKTKESRLDWELSMEKSGILRKLVDNLDAITEEEQKGIDQKLARIERNEDDKMLIIADDFKYKIIGSIE